MITCGEEFRARLNFKPPQYFRTFPYILNRTDRHRKFIFCLFQLEFLRRFLYMFQYIIKCIRFIVRRFLVADKINQ